MAERRLSICLLIPSLDDGGAQRQCIKLANELALRPNVDVSLVVFRDGPHDHLVNAKHVNFVNLGVASNYDPRTIYKVRRHLRRSGADALLTWLQAADFVGPFSTLGLRSSWLLMERNSRHPEDWRFSLRGYLGRWASTIVANSPGGIRYWDQFKTSAQVIVIPNIVESMDESVELEPAKRSGLLHVGRLEKQKRPVLALESAMEAMRRDPELSLRVVGDGSLRGELELIAREFSDRVEFCGFQPEVSRFMRESRILITLSSYEGMPNVLAEAVGAGMGVVASDIVEHTAILGDEYPFLVPIEATTGQISQIIERAVEQFSPRDLDEARMRLESNSAASIGDMYLAAISSTKKSHRSGGSRL